MSFLKQIPHWLLADIILLILALFFKFAMRGYGYIAFALIYAAVLVTLCRFAPDALWKTAIIVTTVGLMYFCAVEGLIIGSARTVTDQGALFEARGYAEKYLDKDAPASTADGR